MKAIVQEAYGPHTVLKLKDVGKPPVAGDDDLIRASLLSAGGRQVGKMFSGAPTTEDLVFLKGLLESGKISPVIDRTYPLSETPAAMGYAAQGHVRRKVVITMSQHDAQEAAEE